MAEDQDPNIYKTKDQNVMRLLFSKGFGPSKIERNQGVITMSFDVGETNADKEECRQILRLWYTNKPIPLADARSYIIAIEQVTSCIWGDPPDDFLRRQ